MAGSETDEQGAEAAQEQGSFWDRFSFDNFSLDSLDSNLLWQVPLIGSGLWFLTSMLFGERREGAQQNNDAWMNLGVIGAAAGAIWYFFMRTPSRESLLEDAAELNVNPQGHDYDYSGAGRRAYDQAYQVELTRFQNGDARTADRSLRSAIEILRDARVEQVPEDAVARADATVDAAIRATVAQNQAAVAYRSV